MYGIEALEKLHYGLVTLDECSLGDRAPLTKTEINDVKAQLVDLLLTHIDYLGDLGPIYAYVVPRNARDTSGLRFGPWSEESGEAAKFLTDNPFGVTAESHIVIHRGNGAEEPMISPEAAKRLAPTSCPVPILKEVSIMSESSEYTADIDTVVSLGPKGEKSASQLTIGDVFQDFGDMDDDWKRVVADNTGEGDTVIIRVVDAPDPDAPEEDPAVAAADTLSNAALVEAAGEAKALNSVEQTWTFFGHWEDDRIVVEWFEPGTVEDDRDDDGEHEQGLWAADASGPDVETAQATAVAEYESPR